MLFIIHNLTGKAIGFGARILTNDKKQPKYINSPETELYNKSRVLYGLYQAKQAIRKEENCYIVEGYTDVISLHQSGIENVVSTSGTALTEEQVKLLGRYTNHVTLLFDGDNAGIKASFRGIDLILEEGLNVKVVLFPLEFNWIVSTLAGSVTFQMVTSDPDLLNEYRVIFSPAVLTSLNVIWSPVNFNERCAFKVK